MGEITRISSGAPWEPVYGYARAVKAGNWVVVSGTSAFDEHGIVGVNQMYVQTRQAIANIRAALERVGLGLHDVVRTRVFVTDISRFSEIARAHRESFGDYPPASTAVEVRRLVHPDMLVEVEADAIADAPARSSATETPPQALRKRRPAPRAKARASSKGSRAKRPRGR